MKYWITLTLIFLAGLGAAFGLLVLLGLNPWVALIAVVFLGVSVFMLALQDVEAPKLEMRESVWYDKDEEDADA